MAEGSPPGAETVTARPGPPLAGLVDSYRGYRYRGFAPGVHRGLPSRHLTFIVSLGEPIDVVVQADPDQRPDRYDTVLAGLQAASAHISHAGDQEGVAIELTPHGARALLGLPARALWNRSHEAADVLGRPVIELRERLAGAATWPERFAVCDDVLRSLVAERSAMAPEVDHAWRRLVASGGERAVADLAQDVGWSRRHLTARFRDELGLSPKLAARVIRFERASLRLRGRPVRSIAEVAAECGYYDQPHLNRDFVDFVGCSPSAWLAAEQLPSALADGP